MFTDLFSETEYAFQLYQALHPEDTSSTANDVIVMTLESHLVNQQYNDLGFMVGDKLIILVKHQSTWSENIVVRVLMYVTDTWNKYIKQNKLDVYGKDRIELPKPELYVVCTGPGVKNKPETVTLKDTLFDGADIAVDCKVKVITDGKKGDIINQFVRFCNVLDGLRECVLLERDNAEELLDLGLGAVHVHITYHYDSLVAGVIPGVIEVIEALIFEGFQMLLQADEGALSQIGFLAKVIRKAALHGTPSGIAALTAFLDDDSALCVNFLGLVEHEVGIVPENHQAAVHHALTLYGDVVEHVLRLFKAGGGVDVAAELRADGTEVVQDALVREVLGSVEAHVLQEMGQTVLCGLVFLNGAYIGGQVEFRTAFRQFVVTDVIGEPVLHLADSDLVGIGKLGHLGEIGFHLLTGGLLRQGQRGSQHKGS